MMHKPFLKSFVWIGFFLISVGPTLSAATAVKDMTFFLHQLTDLDRLPLLETDVTCKQFSSYDRSSKIDEKGDLINWGANADSGQYLRVETTGEAVMAEMEGPGCIVQLWSANPQGKIRFYFDGAVIPLEFDFATITTGSLSPFVSPISARGGAGCNSFLPMPYAKHCKVTADKAHTQYYHIDYLAFPPHTPVKTLHLPLSDQEMKALNSVVDLWNRVGEDPKSVRPKTTRVRKEVVLSPGQTVVLADLKGPAVITSLRMKLWSTERYALRKVLLRAFWEGSKRPSIEAPLGDFFGTGFYENQYKSLPLGMTDDGGYCYWSMPFRKKGHVEVLNEGTQDAKLLYEIAFAPTKLSPHSSLFHAKWRRTAPNTIFDWPFLECKGPGRFVGVEMNVQDPDPGWFGEGDEKVWVDGDTFPSWFGTGTEDYFCDAWGFRPFVRPMHGCTLSNIPGRTSVYRWHVLDSIPFEKQFKMTIENYGKNKDYSCTTYWYQMQPSNDFFDPPPVADRLPWSNKQLGLEAETLTVTGNVQSEIINDETLPEELSNGKALRLTPQETKSTAELKLPVNTEDVFQVVIHSIKGSSPSVEVLSKGQRLSNADQPFADKVVWSLGRIRMTPPSEILTFNLASDERTPLILDTVQLVESQKEHAVLEAEKLPFTVSPGAKADREDARMDWSSWSQLLFEATREGDWIELNLPSDAIGKYQLQMRCTQGLDYGKVEAFLNGQAFGGLFDGHSSNYQLSREFGLGQVQLMGDSGKKLRFKVTGKAEKSSGYKFGLDYLRLAKIVIENAIEAESLRIVQQDKVSAGVQGMEGFGVGKWSGTNQIFCPGQKGQFVVLEVPVAKAGRYLLDLYFTKAIDYGIVEVTFDGKKTGMPFDGYNPGVIPSGKVSYGEHDLSEGPHLLRLEVNDKNPGATGYFMGFDCLTLTPLAEIGK